MGNALSIAATSRILREIIEGTITSYDLDGYAGDDVVVTVEPPVEDLERLRINLFLYRTVQNPHMRNEALPDYNAAGEAISPPLLTLNLHYAVTAYGENDYQSELMMGCAMQALHEVPVVNRALIREILSSDVGANSIMDSRLFEQIDSLRIRHRNLTEEAFLRIWSGFHMPYRLTNFYEVSVVLIESDSIVQVANPVLARPQPNAHSSLAAVTPTLIQAIAPSGAPGDLITLEGVSLAGTNVQLEAIARNPVDSPPPINIPPADVSDNAIQFQIPVAWSVGAYELRVSLDPPGDGTRRQSNQLPFGIYPRITVDATTRDPNPPGLLSIELSVVPDIEPSQRTTLILGGQSFAGPTINAATNSLIFQDVDLPAGAAIIRLQVDGMETAWLDRSTSPATILPAAQIVLP